MNKKITRIICLLLSLLLMLSVAGCKETPTEDPVTSNDSTTSAPVDDGQVPVDPVESIPEVSMGDDWYPDNNWGTEYPTVSYPDTFPNENWDNLGDFGDQGVTSDWGDQGITSDWVDQGTASDWGDQGVTSDWGDQGTTSDWGDQSGNINIDDITSSDNNTGSGDINPDFQGTTDVKVERPSTEGFSISTGVKLAYEGEEDLDDLFPDLEGDTDIDIDVDIDIEDGENQYQALIQKAGEAVSGKNREITVDNSKDGIVFTNFDGLSCNVFPTQSTLFSQQKENTAEAFL